VSIPNNNTQSLLRRIRITILLFVIILALSGITAFAVETELKWLLSYKNIFPEILAGWLQKIHDSMQATNAQYPQLAYGFDWLAFAHLVIALLFIGPYKDPQKNIWVIEWAMLACVCVLPLAFIAGYIRQIPFYWQCIDCSFGIVGLLPLWWLRKWILQLPKNTVTTTATAS
jgi:hypothetical protein